MNIQSITYTDETNDSVAIVCDNCTIYTQVDNPRYGQLVDNWIAEGNTVNPYVPPEPSPSEDAPK